MLNEISLSSVGVLFFNAPVACADGAPDLACRRASATTSRTSAHRARGTAEQAFDAIRTVERVALAAIHIAVTLLLVAGVASLFAQLWP